MFPDLDSNISGDCFLCTPGTNRTNIPFQYQNKSVSFFTSAFEMDAIVAIQCTINGHDFCFAEPEIAPTLFSL